MRTTFTYYSEHHGNTKKLLEGGIAKGHPTEEESADAAKFYQEL